MQFDIILHFNERTLNGRLFVCLCRVFLDQDIPPQRGEQRCHMCQHSQERLETGARHTPHPSGEAYKLTTIIICIFHLGNWGMLGMEVSAR